MESATVKRSERRRPRPTAPASRSRTRRPGRRSPTSPSSSADDVAALVAAARAAQPAWEAAGFEERGADPDGRPRLDGRQRRARRRDDLRRDRPARRRDAVRRALLRGQRARVLGQAGAATTSPTRTIESASPFVRGGRKLKVRYAPVGVVGVIGPWNFPLNNSFGDCIPALAAGNAVVLKPSEITPLTSLLMAEMLAEAGLPEGVFTVATGRGETGAALVDLVDYVMFTGSVKTGKQVMEQAAETLTPVSPRARRQGPDDRPRRRRPRARRQRRRLLRPQQLRPGLHLGRADLRRGRRSTTSSSSG